MERWPVLIFQRSTVDSAAINLSTTWSRDISKLKIPTGIFSFKAIFLAISIAKEVLPIEGRAPRIIKSDF